MTYTTDVQLSSHQGKNCDTAGLCDSKAMELPAVLWLLPSFASNCSAWSPTCDYGDHKTDQQYSAILCLHLRILLAGSELAMEQHSL